MYAIDALSVNHGAEDAHSSHGDDVTHYSHGAEDAHSSHGDDVTILAMVLKMPKVGKPRSSRPSLKAGELRPLCPPSIQHCNTGIQ